MIGFQDVTLACDGNQFTVSGWFDIDDAGSIERICIGAPQQELELNFNQAGYRQRLFESFACQLAVAFHPEIAALYAARSRRAA